VRLYGDKFLFDRAAGKWFVWDGHHWIEDLKGTVVEAVEGVMDLYQAEVARQNNLETEATRAGEVLRAKNHRKIATELLSRISTLRSKHRKENILWRAGIGEDSLAITGEEWDRDPWLFGCLNGDIDLRDGSFGPGERSNYIKTVAPVEWTGLDTSCPAFEKFLSDILVTDTFESDPDMVSFNQRLLGCALAGQVREHIFPILWGPHGRNGKGTLCNLLKQVMGDYSGAIQTETLMQSKHGGNAGGPRSDLMALRGKRIVWASETEGWQHLSPSKVKFLSGGDLIKAREPFGKRDIEFTPSHQVLFLTNPKPRIMAGPGDPLWERLLLIPFHVSYVRSPDPEKPWQREADLSLSNKLEIEKSGVLSWLVRGTLLWLEQGLDPPARVTKATGDYRDEEDILGSFLADATDRGGGVVGTIKANDFYLVYKRWAEAGGVRVMSGTEFGREMPLIVDRKRASGGVGNSYQGIKWNVLGMELYMAVESEKREKAEAKSHDKK
jgi:putative DNA primase/helicase